MGLSAEQVMAIGIHSSEIGQEYKSQIISVKEQISKETELINASKNIKDSRQRILQYDKNIEESGDIQVKTAVKLAELEDKRGKLLYYYDVTLKAASVKSKEDALKAIQNINDEIKALKTATVVKKDYAKIDEEKTKAQLEYQTLQKKLAKEVADGYISEKQQTEQLISGLNSYIEKLYDLSSASSDTWGRYDSSIKDAQESLDELEGRTIDLMDIEEESDEARRIYAEHERDRQKNREAFAIRSLSDYEKEIVAIIKQRDTDISSGVEVGKANEDANKKIKALNEARDKAEKALIAGRIEEYNKEKDEEIKIRKEINDSIISSINNVNSVIAASFNVVNSTSENALQNVLSLGMAVAAVVPGGQVVAGVIGIFKTVLSGLQAASDAATKAKTDALKTQLEKEKELINEELQAELEANGLADDSAVESAQKKVNAAKEALAGIISTYEQQKNAAKDLYNTESNLAALS